MKFSEMSALQRADQLADRGTFRPLTGRATGQTTCVVGSGLVDGIPVLLALTDGHVRGGTLGVRESGILAGAVERVTNPKMPQQRPVALIVGFDTGGVRVEEGPTALAAAAAVGVLLARLTLTGVHLAAVISGPRGCFGAASVMAALPERVVMTEDAHWGLTGPKLLGGILDGAAAEQEGLQATSAANRLANGDTHAVVADTAGAVRAQLMDFVAAAARGGAVPPLQARISASASVTATLQSRLSGAGVGARPVAPTRRRRDLLQYSFRGQWRPAGPAQRRGLIHAALGTLGHRPALGLIVGPEQTRGGGIGIEEAATVVDMVRQAVAQRGPGRAVILTFLFCQGHAVDFTQERFGLHRALAECLRVLVAARLLGHPLVSVLGGGTYGAAYLALVAPSHRILAMRGTSVAPMAPAVLDAFEALRGRKAGLETEAQLAELIPDIRMVENVIRLPHALQRELAQLLATVRPEVDAA
ncbi:MAG: biotin-independent malonate decarboxylase subunit gamma [Candidatus Binatia bacterium]